ncbi:MAG TPA: PEP-CTERM sorting domain-containing protein [Pyrinomonadaceae bacterium]
MFDQAKRRLIACKRVSLFVGLLILSLLSSVQAARADELAIWNFNDSDLLVDHGTGTLSTNFNPLNVLFAAGTLTNARQGDLAGQALSLQGGTGNANNGRNLTFNVSTVGFTGITVSFATQGTATGFTSNQFQYSLDGVTFVDFNSPYVPPAAFGSAAIIFTLASIAGLDNNPNAAFRIVFNGATSATGNNRIDNFVVGGANTTVPEPNSILLLSSGLGALFMLYRRTAPLRE